MERVPPLGGTGQRAQPLPELELASPVILLFRGLELATYSRDLFVLPEDLLLEFLYSLLEHRLIHLLDLQALYLLLLLQLDHEVLLLRLPHPPPQQLVLLRQQVNLRVQPQRLFPEDDHLLLEVLDAIVGGEHLLLLLGFVLDLCEFLLDLGDVVAVGVEELRLVLLDHVLDLLVHLVDRPVEVLVGLVEGLRGLGGDELALALHLIKLIYPEGTGGMNIQVRRDDKVVFSKTYASMEGEEKREGSSYS